MIFILIINIIQIKASLKRHLNDLQGGSYPKRVKISNTGYYDPFSNASTPLIPSLITSDESLLNFQSHDPITKINQDEIDELIVYLPKEMHNDCSLDLLDVDTKDSTDSLIVNSFDFYQKDKTLEEIINESNKCLQEMIFQKEKNDFPIEAYSEAIKILDEQAECSFVDDFCPDLSVVKKENEVARTESVSRSLKNTNPDFSCMNNTSTNLTSQPVLITSDTSNLESIKPLTQKHSIEQKPKKPKNLIQEKELILEIYPKVSFKDFKNKQSETISFSFNVPPTFGEETTTFRSFKTDQKSKIYYEQITRDLEKRLPLRLSFIMETYFKLCAPGGKNTISSVSEDFTNKFKEFLNKLIVCERINLIKPGGKYVYYNELNLRFSDSQSRILYTATTIRDFNPLNSEILGLIKDVLLFDKYFHYGTLTPIITFNIQTNLSDIALSALALLQCSDNKILLILVPELQIFLTQLENSDSTDCQIFKSHFIINILVLKLHYLKLIIADEIESNKSTHNNYFIDSEHLRKFVVSSRMLIYLFMCLNNYKNKEVILLYWRLLINYLSMKNLNNFSVYLLDFLNFFDFSKFKFSFLENFCVLTKSLYKSFDYKLHKVKNDYFKNEGLQLNSEINNVERFNQPGNFDEELMIDLEKQFNKIFDYEPNELKEEIQKGAERIRMVKEYFKK